MFGPESKFPLNSALLALIDAIVEGRKLQRLPDRGLPLPIPDLDINIKDFSIHVPIQIWPLRHVTNCPCSFCDECPDPSQMEFYLAARHNQIFLNGMFYSELQVKLAGLLGIDLQIRKHNRWRCPFDNCSNDYSMYKHIAQHIMMEQTSNEKLISSKVGRFWTALLRYFHQWGQWLRISDIFQANEDRVQGQMASLP
jgi:hypothetical protein